MQVKPEQYDSVENFIKKFTRKVKKSELISKLLERRFYKKPSVVAREKEKARRRVLEELKKENQQANGWN